MSIEDVKDPADNVSVFQFGDPLGMGLSVAGAVPGDVLDLKVYSPDGTVYYTTEQVVSQDYPHTFWYWNGIINGMYALVGTYTLEVKGNGELLRSYEFEVEGQP